MAVTSTQAIVLRAAADGRLRRWREDLDAPFAGKSYARGVGTIARPTIDALMAAEPPLLAVGERTERDEALTLTQTGRAALAASQNPYVRHVGKARR